MSLPQDFRTQTTTAMTNLAKLLDTKSVKEYESVYATVKSTFRAWESTYNTASETSLSSSARTALESAARKYDALWDKVRAHRKAIADDPQPLEGGRKWKMPRKMTRRYCRKTSCRKMGFTQRASCRPWKNCF